MRKEPCEFCGEDPYSLLFGALPVDDTATLASVDISGHDLVLRNEKDTEVDSMPISFCPICGRELEW